MAVKLGAKLRQLVKKYREYWYLGSNILEILTMWRISPKNTFYICKDGNSPDLKLVFYFSFYFICNIILFDFLNKSV